MIDKYFMVVSFTHRNEMYIYNYICLCTYYMFLCTYLYVTATFMIHQRRSTSRLAGENHPEMVEFLLPWSNG